MRDTPEALAERLIAVLAAHTDGVGRGLAYSPFHWDGKHSFPLPASMVQDLNAAGFAFYPDVYDGSGWRRYVTRDGRYTVLVEGWGDHCIGEKNCKVPRFEQELRRRLEAAGLSPSAVLWSSIPLTLKFDRWGNSMPPLKFRTVSVVVVDGEHPVDFDEGAIIRGDAIERSAWPREWARKKGV